jgi:SAM-dependent methyltransferase
MDADAWDHRYADASLLWSAEPNRFAAEELGPLPPGRALDLAAGEGRNAIWLASRGWTVTAIDFSAVAIARGRELSGKLTAGEPAAGDDRIEWIVADVLQHRPTPAAFDAVLVAYLHLPPDALRAVLAVAATAVAPGGIALVIGHDLANLDGGTGGPQNPDILYTPETVAAALPGLTVERAERVRRPVEGTDGAIDTVVRARRPAT